ncbi:bifunctional folylpolyglutamate synthase/dihydrofolate synthase [Candidatus Woesearchaeota archaeon CG10_big_fil_rev_8_21_14_0_10_36_11]|nr:MAG: bifunctional folylpolyglutamate synthase/dihydrofolate synthase [Candidatus Woesearchaeota archaeon CG10_big_fil_rev_8_21_14_0_10_36_11]
MSQNYLEYLTSLHLFGSKLGLVRMRALMEVCNYPYRKFLSVHVAGTNGKGSVCSYLASILQNAGYKVGLYTSPYLVTFNERIKINGNTISDTDLAVLVMDIRNKLGSMETTFFEFTTALAFHYFAQNNVDIAIIEVGLGGRLDATNVITPLVSVITSISEEHQKILGNTKELIAKEKAGIIKDTVPVVVGKNNQGVISVIRNICKERDSPLFLVDVPVIHQSMDPLLPQTFSYRNKEYTIKMLGEHQIDNACIAIDVCELLRKGDFSISDDALRKGLLETKWPGRLEIVQKDPFILLDGAHNVACCEVLKQFLKRLPQKKIMILGISEDKEIEKMVALLAPLAETIILTESSHKPVSVVDIEHFLAPYNKVVIRCLDVQEAIQKAISVTKKDDMIIVTGSLYLVGDVLKHKLLFHNVFK